jgi:glycosyltransferase involved in cell wall biosynthesis
MWSKVTRYDPTAIPILIIGPFPPPVHGFAAITLALSEIIAQSLPVIRSDLSSNNQNMLLRHAGQIGRCLMALGQIFAFGMKRGRVVSLGANGGWGLVYTLMMVVAVRTMRMRLYFHHHSYAYIINYSRLMATICALAGPRLVHVFLAQSMQEAFFSRYPQTAAAHVLPNAVFVDSSPSDGPSRAGRLAVGLLSNLGRTKGLYDFIELAKKIKAAELPIDMLLAGPAPVPADAAAIEAAQNDGLLKAFGPLYGPQKMEFFRNLDLFLFPTRHIDEAQPTVIYEAFANGVPVLAFARGAIVEQVGDCFGTVPVEESFCSAALACCTRLAALEASDRVSLREKTRQRHANDLVTGRAKLVELFGI